jgi:hypothetical protein
MKKYILILGIMCLSFITHACDVCGCYTGVLPYESKNSIGLYSRYRAFKNEYFSGSNEWFPEGSLFKTVHSSGTEKVSSYEVFRAIELRGRWFIKPNWELNINLPYLQNIEAEGSQRSAVQGMGDVSFNVLHHIVSDNCNRQFKNRLIVGVGIKLPTGRNDFTLSNGQRTAFYNQPGTGSLDYNFMANYAVGYKKLGYSVSTNYRCNSTNSFNERLASVVNASSMLFYKWNVSNRLLVVPSIINTFEKTKGVRIGDALQNGTSMQLMMMGAGLQFIYKSIALDSQLLLPVDEPKSLNSQQSTVRIVIGLSYNI